MNIYFKYRKYPNTSMPGYVEISLNGEIIGRLDIVDGGYIQIGGRKPTPFIEGAVDKMISNKCKKLSKSLDKLEDLLHQFQCSFEDKTLKFIQVDDDIPYPKE